MLKLRTTLGLLLACAACALLLWVLNRPAMRRTPADAAHADRIFTAPLEAADYLMVERGALRVELRRDADAWSIVQPFAAPADQTAVRRLLDVLERAPRRETLSADELALRELGPEVFGLATPQARIVVAGSSLRAELLVGNRTPPADGTFVCFAQSGEVLVTDDTLLAALPANVNALRDRALYRGDTRRVTALALRRSNAPFVKLVREKGRWQIVQPVVARAEDEPVQAILDTLAAAQVDRFIWPSSTNGVADAGTARRAGLLGFGLDLDEGSVQLQLWESGDPAGLRFRFGAAAEGLPDRVYALTPDGQSVVAVTGAVLRAVLTPLDALRDKRVLASMPGAIRALDIHAGNALLSLRRSAEGPWELAAPVVDRADQPTVARLIEDLLRLHAGSITDGPDGAAVVSSNVIARADLTTDSGTRRLLVGRDAANPALAGLCFGDEATVYWVPATNLPPVLTGGADATALRDRTVLAVPVADIRRLAVRRAAGQTEAVEQEPDGTWRPAVAGESLDRLALDGWLGLLALLRAERVESLGAADPQAYGLQEPYLEVTLDLNATDALRRVLRLGRLTATGGRFAALKGHDAVFALSAETVRAMEPVITRPPPTVLAPR